MNDTILERALSFGASVLRMMEVLCIDLALPSHRRTAFPASLGSGRHADNFYICRRLFAHFQTLKLSFRYSTSVLCLHFTRPLIFGKIFSTLTACGPSDGKEIKDVFGRPGARVEVGSAR